MRKKKVLVHGTPDSLKKFFADAISHDYEVVALLNEGFEKVSIVLGGGYKELEVIPSQSLPKFISSIIDAIIITDNDDKNSVRNFFLQQGFEPNKIILWNDKNGLESFELQNSDGTRMAFVNGLDFPLRNEADKKALNKYISSLKKMHGIRNLDPKLYDSRIFKNPPLDPNDLKTFTDKLNWLKVHDATPLKSRLADKYRVRNWVSEKIGSEYLIPLLGVWDSFDEINFDDLPDQFILKCNHSSAKNIIVRDKKTFDKERAHRNINLWMSINYIFAFELHYGSIDRKIIAEKLMNTSALLDYKFWCFNGEPIYCALVTGRLIGNICMTFFDMNWNATEVERSDYPRSEPPEDIQPPKNFELMKELVTKLAEGFAFVRVDLYEIEGKVYFGEMTFTPGGGVFSWKSEGTDEYLGSLLKLPEPTPPPKL